MKTALFWWTLTLVWAIHIFWLSTETFTGDQSRPLLAKLLEFLRLDLPPSVFRIVHLTLRKGAHVVEFGVLALFLYRSLGRADGMRWHARRAWWCIGLVCVYALTDEFHQLFVQDRGASVLDSALDTAGAGLAMLGLYLRSRIFDLARRFAATRTMLAPDSY